MFSSIFAFAACLNFVLRSIATAASRLTKFPRTNGFMEDDPGHNRFNQSLRKQRILAFNRLTTG